MSHFKDVDIHARIMLIHRNSMLKDHMAIKWDKVRSYERQ
jgi:hypothetical protein